jgi:signal transduction histidine kinase
MALAHSQLQAQKERQIREEQDKLLAMLAHELKTPLSIMTLRLDHSASGSQEIRQAIRDMDNVIERCLQTNALGEHQLSAHFEWVDLVSALRDVVSCTAQPTRFQFDTPPQMRVHTDRQLLFIVLNNLLENASKYAATDAPVLLGLQSLALPDRLGFVARLEVSHPPGTAGWPDAGKVFQKYYRSPNAKRQAGTGLGLFLVRNLAEVLGGRVDYLPSDQAVRFVVQLPMGLEAGVIRASAHAALWPSKTTTA